MDVIYLLINGGIHGGNLSSYVEHTQLNTEEIEDSQNKV